MVWIQFSYARVFKFFYKCGCIGHQEYRCPLSFEQAHTIIRHRIHAARPEPESNFWVMERLDLYSREIKAYTNSNINRKTRIEILWSEDALADDILEVVNAVGARIIFFIRHAPFVASDDDPMEPSSGDDDNDDDDSHESDRTVTEPFNPTLEENDNMSFNNVSSNGVQQVLDHWINEESRSGPSHIGLDDSFERAFNALGLTSDENNAEVNNKQAGTDLVGGPSKKPKNIVDLDLHDVTSLDQQKENLVSNENAMDVG